MVDDATSEHGDDESDAGLQVQSVGAPADGCLRLCGELDAASSDVLFTTARETIALGAGSLRFLCADLRFCDSAGLRALVLLSREVEGPLTLVEPSPMLVRLLEVTGLLDAFVLDR